MSQATNWGVPTVGPVTPGSYASRDNESFNALLSLHRGASRPSYAVAGMLWVEPISASTEHLYLYDGTGDIYVGHINPTTHHFTPVNSGTLLSNYLNGTSAFTGLKVNGNVDVSGNLDIGSGDTRRLAPSGTFVNNANGTPNLSGTEYQITSYVSVNTWESFGPTGSGADNIWTALDLLPADANWIEVCIKGSGQSGAASSFISSTLYAKSVSSSPAFPYGDNIILELAAYSDASGGCYTANGITKKLPVDASNMFSLRYSTTFTGNTTYSMHLDGFGFNPLS